MTDTIFSILESIDNIVWYYVALTISIFAGLYFSVKTGFYQLKVLIHPKNAMRAFYADPASGRESTNVIRHYFTTIGGMIGLGNLVAVISALMLGGPGSLVWLWVASFFGMVVKYAEVYIGMTHRTVDAGGVVTGGPLSFLSKAYGLSWISPIVGVLLCIYGVEIYQFLIVTDTVSSTFHWGKIYVLAMLLFVLLFVSHFGVKSITNICVYFMPVLIIGYVGLCLAILWAHAADIPDAFSMILSSAVQGHAPLGGFAGSSLLMAAQYGFSRGAYGGDIDVNMDPDAQKKARFLAPEDHARLGIFSLLMDSVICTLSILVVIVTGVWTVEPQLESSHYIANALSTQFPHMDVFMAIFFLLAGFTAIIGYFTIGLSSAEQVSKKWGKPIYLTYGILAFTFFSFFEQSRALCFMSIAGGILMTINVVGLWKMRSEIKFK